MILKTKIGVFFGGRSTEHEISVISAMQAIAAFDREKYDVIPVYITKDCKFYTGEAAGKIENYKDIPVLLKTLTRVTLEGENGKLNLISYPAPIFGKGLVDTIDVAFPVVHGTNVEDGTLQGYFQSFGIPYAGCDVPSSALGMDKFASKAVMKMCGLPVLDCVRVTANEYTMDEDAVIAKVESQTRYPVIVKPVNLGSSIGIKKADDNAALREALEYAFGFANLIIVEDAVQNLREINCSVLGNKEDCEASVCEEPLNATTILTFEDKYLAGGKSGGVKGSKGTSAGMADTKRQCPANIPDELRDKIRGYAKKTFEVLGCSGVSRIDFLMDNETKEVWVNEINTCPGSLSFYLWEATGIKFNELLDRIVKIALARARDEKNLTFSFDTNILQGISLGGAKGAKGGAKS
ncbi:MAG: D-alanine--D-alanine ligase [Ruminococcaceae bacterium]|nr:D-alanine--D-alanine ligase [Oscillospiraceae bacterium]